MPDILKHPLIKQSAEVSAAIVLCGVSPELTAALGKSYDLTVAIEKLVDALGIALPKLDPEELMVVYRQYASPTDEDPFGERTEVVAVPLEFFQGKLAAHVPKEEQFRTVATRRQLEDCGLVLHGHPVRLVKVVAG